MEENTKKQITADLIKYVAKFPSQNQAASSLRNVSSATVSNIIKGKTMMVANDMWRNISKQIGSDKGDWKIVPTNNFNLLNDLFTDSALYANVYGVVGDASVGKTETSDYYALNHPNVFLVKCDEFWNKRHFVSETLRSMHQDSWGYTTPDLMDNIIKHVLKVEKPLFIFDEIDKVQDSILCSIISIYNRLEGKAGLVLMSTKYFEQRLERGLKLNKRGFEELYSRLGKKLIVLDKTKRSDIEAIVTANGITDEEEVARIVNDCDNDLRRVKRLVHKFKMKGKK